jgi:superfamily II DNA or RNA helicase
MPDRDSDLQELARLEARLEALAEERCSIEGRIARLRAERVSVPVPSLTVAALPPASVTRPVTPAEKVALFRSLFRGRDDVFPLAWSNPRKGTRGYSPACSNEWQRGICEKPRVKCGQCPHQAFRRVTDKEVLDHLQGRQVMGVYPLLQDERCHLLAVDFDKDGWRDDVLAFAETCRAIGVPAAVERSRSGNGAHAWFFFEAAVPALLARRVGCYLLTETMTCRPALGMASYDRLFPNQDTMPKGGLGNLIALPLQHEARQRGNTVFIDDGMRPFDDQWAFLSSVSKIPVRSVELIAREAHRQGRVVGARFSGIAEEGAPWLRPPSGAPSRPAPGAVLTGPVRVVEAQRLFIERGDLPPAFVNQLRHLAAFQNPEFYKKQAMRLSTHATPRVITCCEDTERFVSLPRGCLDDLRDLVRTWGGALDLGDERQGGAPLDVTFRGELTPTQDQAARAMLAHDTGVLVAPPGTGKTVLGAHLIAKRGVSTLILVHRKPILDQWVAQLSEFLGVPKKEIGVLGGGKRKAAGRLDVAMLQSLVRKGRVDDLVAGYGHVIVDECHHVSAASFERVLSEVKARFVTGLTATPHRRDGHDPIIQMQLGPVRFEVSPREAARVGGLEHRLVVRETTFTSEWAAGDPIQGLYGQLAADPGRNDLILDDLLAAVSTGRSPLLLTERRDHLEFFERKLASAVRHLIVLHGGLGTKARRAALERLAAIPPSEERVVLATGRYIGEGFDDPRLDTLLLALPVAWKGTVAQYAGRLHRRHAGKTGVRIHDYRDGAIPVLARMLEKRIRAYRAAGYELTEMDAPLPPTELVVEYDEQAVVGPEAAR